MNCCRQRRCAGKSEQIESMCQHEYDQSCSKKSFFDGALELRAGPGIAISKEGDCLFVDSSGVVDQGELSVTLGRCGGYRMKIDVAPCVVLDVVFESSDSACTRGSVDINFVSHENSTLKVTCMADLACMPDLAISWELSGPDAHVDGVVAYVAHRNDGSVLQELPVWRLKTVQYHSERNCQSSLVVKGLLAARGHVFHEGLIKIDDSGIGTHAQLHHTALIIHEQAHVEIKPELEILAHEVSCQHGAAVGYFDQEQRVYLQSRGLSYQEACKLLIDSFFNDVLSPACKERWRSFLDDVVMNMP